MSPKAVLQKHTWWALAAHGLLGSGAAAARSNPLTHTRCGQGLLSTFSTTLVLCCLLVQREQSSWHMCEVVGLTCCSLCATPAKGWVTEVLPTRGVYCVDGIYYSFFEVLMDENKSEWVQNEICLLYIKLGNLRMQIWLFKNMQINWLSVWATLEKLAKFGKVFLFDCKKYQSLHTCLDKVFKKLKIWGRSSK